MSAPVRIEAEAWDDLRFGTLARVLGLADPHHALIRVARLWSWQAEHYTPDAPTYVVDADTIDSALERAGGAAAMVRARLAEEVPEGFRICGAHGRIEWLWQRRQNAKAGGEATKRKRDHKEVPGGAAPGLPVGQPPAEPNASPLVPALVPDPEKISPSAPAIPPTAVQAPAIPRTERPIVPAVSPPAPAREDIARTQPAADSAPVTATDLGFCNRPRILQPTVVHRDPKPSNVTESIAGQYNPDDPRSRGRLAEATYRRVSDALVAIAADLRRPAPLPFPAITPGSHPASLRDLQDRVREEGAAAALVCDRVVANLIAQAREERSVEWLAEKTFKPSPWARARQWTPGAAARARGPQRGDPLPPAPAPRREPSATAIVIPPDEREDVAAMARELRDRLNGTARAPPRSAEPMSEQPDPQPQPQPLPQPKATP